MLSVLFALLAGAAHADVNASKCLDAARVQKINSQFQVVVDNDRQGNPGVPPLDSCDPASIQYKLFQAIMYIEDLPVLTINPDSYDQNVMTDVPEKYFTDRIEVIHFDPADSSPCADGNAAAYVRHGEGKIMHICPVSKDSDLLYMVTILIHEARHVEGYGHVTCSHGRWAGQFFGGCDPNYEYRGAYAVETEFNIRLSRTNGIPPEIRESARGLAVETFLDNFDVGPFGVRKGLITERADGQIGFFDGTTTEPLFTIEHPDDLVIMRANLATVYDLTNGSVKSYLNDKAKVETGGIYATNFRAFDPTVRKDMRDILYLGPASCFLTAKHVRCDKGAKTSEFDITKIKPRNLVVIAEYIAIQDYDGFIYTMDPAQIGTPGFNESILEPSGAPLNTLSLLEWENMVKIGIDKDGVVRHFDVTGQPQDVIKELEGARYKKLLGPTWWSAHLADF